MDRYFFPVAALTGPQTAGPESPPWMNRIASPEPSSSYGRRTPLTSTSLTAGADVALAGIRRETSKGTIAVRLGFMMTPLRTLAAARVKIHTTDSCTAARLHLFDHLVGAGEQRWRDFEAERLRS